MRDKFISELWIYALIIFQEGKSEMTSWVSYFITIKKKFKKEIG